MAAIRRLAVLPESGSDPERNRTEFAFERGAAARRPPPRGGRSMSEDSQLLRSRHHQILVVGGGTAGITVAARLRRARRGLDVAIVEPNEHHDYQPLWTLVGAGVVRAAASRRAEAPLIPAGVAWIRDAVDRFDPERNRVVTRGGEELRYDWLVVCPGIQLNWDGVAGLAKALGSNGVCSNYAYDQCERTWDGLRSFRGGTALFTMPPPPIKCAGAPQKIMYLADDHFRRAGVRDRTRIVYVAGTPSIFSVKEYAATLDQVCARKGIERHFKYKLVELRPDRREARFVHLETQDEMVIGYDFAHVTPPQGPPDFVKRSPLADAAGWVEVNRNTLQHARFSNVFSLGDASSLPTSRTGAAIRKQAPVLVANLLAELDGLRGGASYDGYAACPIPTGYGKLLLCEFDYDLRPAPSFPLLDSTAEHRAYYWLKRYGLPALYWHGMLRGIA
jgi:sulfide:quinone oxidoreductase